MAHGPITIDRALMSLDSPPVELEIVASSSSRVTPRPPAQIQAGDDGASDGGEGGAEEFKGSTDQELRAKIARLRSLHGNTNDRGEKSRKLVRRVEKELERRRTAGPRKVSRMCFLCAIVFWGQFSDLRAFPQSGFVVHTRIIDIWIGKLGVKGLLFFCHCF
jgi:hypothetical protein